MWCGFQNHFYPLQDTEQRYPAPPDRVPPHWALVFHCSQWSQEWCSSSWKTLPFVNDTTPKFCWLSWLHHHWLHWCPDPASGAGTARGRAESHPCPLRPAGTTSDCKDLLHCWRSTRTATAARPNTSCPESANIPASKSSPAEIPGGSTMLPLWMGCSGVNHLYTHK